MRGIKTNAVQTLGLHHSYLRPECSDVVLVKVEQEMLNDTYFIIILPSSSKGVGGEHKNKCLLKLFYKHFLYKQSSWKFVSNIISIMLFHTNY